MELDEHLVHDAESTVRRTEDAGEHTHYLTYNPGPGTQDAKGKSETCVIAVRLPKGATGIRLHGPGHFGKRGKGEIYGVKITFVEKTERGETEHSRTIEIPGRAVDVQLLDRKPDEAYKAVA